VLDERALAERAERHGIAAAYADVWGRTHHAAPAVLERLLEAMRIDERTQAPELLPAAIVVRGDRQPLRCRVAAGAGPITWHLEEESGARYRGAVSAGELTIRRELPFGYHRLTLHRGSDRVAESTVVVTPGACFRPPALANGARVWGITAQLYGLRSARNWGIGDFTDLAQLVEQWAARGADLVGLNPLHALFPHNPAHASPYSPSSRLFVNVLYVDVEAVEDFRECAEVVAEVRSAPFQALLRSLRDAPLVDYPSVAGAKMPMLERLYGHFRARHQTAGTRCSRRSRSAFIAAIVRSGGGPRGPRLTATPAPPRSHGSRSSIAQGWGSSSTCSGRPICSSRRSRTVLVRADAASACIGTSPYRSTVPARRAGRIRNCTRSRRASAPRLMPLVRRVRTGACRHPFPRACARPRTHRSLPRCARTCGTRARCASIT
jgi:hypothetical protein